MPLEFSWVVITEPLVSVEEAKSLQLRIFGTATDADIAEKLAAAQDRILQHMGTSGDATWTAATVPSVVKRAILILTTHFYEDRGDRAKDTDAAAADQVWRMIDLLLARHRDVTLA